MALLLFNSRGHMAGAGSFRKGVGRIMVESSFRWENAYIEESKIVDYLLSTDHPVGAGKAKFVLSVGYTRSDWTRLRDDLLIIAREGDIAVVNSSPYGVKTSIDGTVTTPNDVQISLRTVWIDNCLDDAQRLVTAYPN